MFAPDAPSATAAIQPLSGHGCWHSLANGRLVGGRSAWAVPLRGKAGDFMDSDYGLKRSAITWLHMLAEAHTEVILTPEIPSATKGRVVASTDDGRVRIYLSSACTSLPLQRMLVARALNRLYFDEHPEHILEFDIDLSDPTDEDAIVERLEKDNWFGEWLSDFMFKDDRPFRSDDYKTIMCIHSISRAIY